MRITKILLGMLLLAAVPALAQAKKKSAPPKEAVGATSETVGAEEGAVKEDKEEVAEKGRSDEGLLGPFNIGPSFSIAAIPRIFVVGTELKFMKLVGAQLDYGFIPGIPIYKGTTVSANSFSFAARLYPFLGSFFLGVGVGRQSIKGSKTETINSVSAEATIDVGTTFLTPHIGWRWEWLGGFFMGMEYGWQFNLNSSTTFATTADAPTQATQEYRDLEARIRDVGNAIGERSLPHLVLVQFGYYF
jgi:hypothetical protein